MKRPKSQLVQLSMAVAFLAQTPLDVAAIAVIDHAMIESQSDSPNSSSRKIGANTLTNANAADPRKKIAVPTYIAVLGRPCPSEISRY